MLGSVTPSNPHEAQTKAMYSTEEFPVYQSDYYNVNPVLSENFVSSVLRVEKPGQRSKKFLLATGTLLLGLIILDGALGGTILGF